ncbi:MAG: hypothetical protein FWE33_07635 [Defluviitaleaceae bacterium]|nr:hypothetical protein [Defluviitaleaceae bacterium]
MADDDNKTPLGDDEDLDAMLKALMEEDSADEWKPDDNFEDILTNNPIEEQEEVAEETEEEPEEDIPMYEPKKEEAEENEEAPKKGFKLPFLGKKGEKPEKIKKVISKSTKIIYGLAGLAALALLGVGAILLYELFSDDTPRPHQLNQPNARFNNAASSFIELFATIDDELIALTQVLLDDTATIFYFEGNLDLNRYVFALEDFNGRVYNKDIAFATNPLRQLIVERTEVRFEPISREAEAFTLTITDLQSNAAVSVDMAFDGERIPVGRYFNDFIIFDNLPVRNLSVILNHAEFSASGSTIGLSIFQNMSDGGIVFAQQEDVSPISIYHRGASVPPVNNVLHVLEFDDGAKFARMDFGVLRTLHGDIEIVLDGLYRQYNLNHTMSVTPLFTPGASRVQTIQLADNYQLILEGMQRQGDLMVMPMHGINTTTGDRATTTISAYIIGMDTDGVTHRLSADVRYGAIGADVLFYLEQNPAFSQIPVTQMQLEIEYALIKLPPTSHKINLRNAEYAPSERRQEIINALENHFVPQINRQNDGLAPIAQVITMQEIGGIIRATVIERHLEVRSGRLHDTTMFHMVEGRIQDERFVVSSIETVRR